MPTALVLTAVGGRVTDDLATSLRAVSGWDVVVRTAVTEADWLQRRSQGGCMSLLMRLRVLGWPAVVRLRLSGGALPDVIIATTNPFWLPARLAMHRKRGRVICLVYDLYPDALLVNRRRPGWVVRVIGWLVALGVRRSDAVVVLGDRIRRIVIQRFDLRQPVHVIPTGSSEVAAAPVTMTPDLERLANSLSRRVVLSYLGNAGAVHDVAALGRALARLTEEGLDASVVVSTRGARASELLRPLQHQSGVYVLPPLSDDEWRWIINRTDIALVALDREAGAVSVPSKTYPAMSAGSAILAVVDVESDLADLIVTASCGLVVDPQDEDAILDAARLLVVNDDLREQMGRLGKMASHGLSPRALSRKWAAVLDA